MDDSESTASQLARASKRIARSLLTIGENRLQLLTVELHEERERLVHALLLALGVVAFALLAVMSLTVAVIVLFWSYSPIAVLLGLTAIYGLAAAFLGWKLAALLRDWQTLPASLDQLRKDRACLEKVLA